MGLAFTACKVNLDGDAFLEVSFVLSLLVWVWGMVQLEMNESIVIDN